MASSLPPVKNAAFTFYTALVSQADTNIFKTGPTLAAGDIVISIDGGNFANITTLPTQVQSTGVLPVALTASEMNGDIITVLFHDASGAEWQDQVVTIFTAAQTLDTTDGIADDIKATVNHADYGNAKLVRSTTPANQLLTDASGHVSISGTKNTLDALNDIDVAAIIAGITDGTYDLQEMLRIIFAVLAGKSSGSGTSTVKFRDPADSKDRVSATVTDGNRTAVTLNAS